MAIQSAFKDVIGVGDLALDFDGTGSRYTKRTSKKGTKTERAINAQFLPVTTAVRLKKFADQVTALVKSDLDVDSILEQVMDDLANIGLPDVANFFDIHPTTGALTLKAGSITATELALGVISTSNLADLSVTRPKIALDAVDGTLIEDNAVDSEHVAAGALDFEHHSVDSVGRQNLDLDNSGSYPHSYVVFTQIERQVSTTGTTIIFSGLAGQKSITTSGMGVQATFGSVNANARSIVRAFVSALNQVTIEASGTFTANDRVTYSVIELTTDKLLNFMGKKIALRSFEGGISNFINPRIAQLNTSSELLDADVKSGAIVPEASISEVPDPNIPELTYQTGSRSIVRFGKDYFWSDNDTGELGSSIGYMGIDPPTNDSFSVSLGNPGDRFEGTYKYLIRYETDNGDKSAAFFPDSILNFQVIVNTSLETSVDFQLADLPNFSDLINDGDVFKNAGLRVNHIDKSWLLKIGWNPSNFLSQAEITAINIERGPGQATNRWEDITGSVLVYNGHESIVLSNFVRPLETKVTKVLIYRTLANGSVFYLNQRVTLTSEARIEDTTLDAELASNEQLGDAGGAPPVYLNGVRIGARYLTEVNEKFYLAADNSLYPSLQSNPHAYNPDHTIDFDAPITGLARAGDDLLVFLGEGPPYLVTGNREDGTLSKIQLPTTQGCSNWRTITYAGNSPLWKSSEGVSGLFKRPDGELPVTKVLTRDIYVFPERDTFALAKDDSYFLFYEDHVVKYDIARQIITKRSLTADYGFVSSLDNKMYLVTDHRFYDADAGPPLEMTYVSSDINAGDATTLKTFNQLQIDITETFKLSLWYDGRQVVIDKEISASLGKITAIPQQRCYNLRIGIKTLGELYGILIDFQV